MLAALIFSLQFKSVQTFVAQKAANYLSKELDTKISIRSIYFKPFKSLVLEDFIVLDRQQDTLANFTKFTVDLNRLSLKERVLDINTVQINNGFFFLKNYKQGGNNLAFLIDYFSSPTSSAPKKSSGKKFQLVFKNIVINNLHFKYKNLKHNKPTKGVNYDDIDITQFSGILENLNTKDHLIQTQIKNLTFKEKSGFYLKNLSAFTTVDTNQIELKNLLLLTPQSKLTDYYQMKFNGFKDFSDYVSNVRMKAHFTDSYIESKDVAFFAPALEKIKLGLNVDGNISGLVSNIKAKKLSIKVGKATYIKGDFNLKGLPDWEQTFMDMKIEMAGTNKKDLDNILTGFSNKKQSIIPKIVDKFGNINFNGEFTGFQNDFIAFGEFKTKLGRVKSDINMKIDQRGIPSYTGNVKAYDFNLGELTETKNIGKITSELYVKGRGSSIKTMREELNGKVAYIDFNNYRYQNITINGIFDKRYFNGNLKINDKNVKLAFKGGVNLNPKLPEFNFTAQLQDAKLKALKLYKDSLRVNALLSANFSGTNLDNIQGHFNISQINLKHAKKEHHIDSLALNASGIGAARSLTIKSDILEASITGQYNLGSLFSYYKTIAKRYIPSLNIGKVNISTQIFQVNLRIKQFEPIADIFIPGLSIEDQVVLIGSFDSKNNQATLSGGIKKLTYKGISATNIILDEGTSDKQLQAIITTDRVDLSKDLYIKNVNITNILRNDSLSLNVKLSNQDDASQLDLNGLVEFAQDSTAKISVLPSNVIINNENWEIEEKVKINFDKGKTQIDDFQLSKDKQHITINGILSEDPKDILAIGFKNFKLKTLDPFVQSSGIRFSGNTNGVAKIAGILKSPKINDSLRIDSLAFNDIYIGNLVDTSSYNRVENNVRLFTNIIADNKETFKITGGVDLEKKEIDISLKLDESKLTIVEPFVNKIISHLNGSISADLSIKGSLENPQINGYASFDKGQLTVNYLKTTYLLNDKIGIENSKLNLNQFKIEDIEGHTAIANGTVDLNNPSNPNINLQIDARNFMALNTTSKDNPLYYGKAYGTGKFSFKGHTDKLLINIDAKTEKGTVFNLPLNSTGLISDKDFITFVSKDSTANNTKKPTDFGGLTMSFSLKVDPNSLINIYTAMGNLSGRGKADLNLNINSVGDFEMLGDYIIETGNFDFTAQEVINKRFEIRQGGTVRWTGNPTNAQINLKTIYALRVNNLKDLYTAANKESSASGLIPVEVEMGLSGLLMKPDIKLDISFPANPAYKEDLQSYLNDGNNLSLQAFSLIIQRRFAAMAGSNIGQQLGTVGESTATELLFSQLNSVLSSLNLNFVDINIKSLNEANASFKFFNDRIIINAGVVDNTSRNANPATANGPRPDVIGKEVEVLGLIKKDGSLIGKLANKPPTLQSTFTNPGIDPYANVTSLGLIYVQQFDSFDEFFRKVIGIYQKEKQTPKPRKNKPEAILNERKKNKNR